MTSYYRDPAAPAPNVPRRVGVTALIERDGSFLVERRADNAASEWAFVGGGVAPDEQVLDARIVAYPDGNVCSFISIVFCVSPRGASAPAPSDESRGERFVARDELAVLPIWPAQRPIRDALLREPREPVVE